MEKKEIIRALEEIGELLEIQGENPFRCRAYLNAARVLEGIAETPTQLVTSGKILEVKGVGPALAEKITEMVNTGKLIFLEELRQAIPAGVVELLKIPNLGPKKAKILFDKLGCKSIGELEYACKENRLVDLKGFGLKTQENILKGMELLKKTEGQYRYDFAYREAELILQYLKTDKKVIQAEIAGSLRRSKEVVADIDLLCSVRGAAEPIIQKFKQYPKVGDILGAGDTKVSVRLINGIQIDLRVMSEQEFPFAWLYFTGNKEHNTHLRGIAKGKGLKLNEYGLFRGNRSLNCKNEAEIYEALALHYIPPEAREGMGEIEFASQQPFPRLVEYQDLQGIFHVHSDWSDGTATIFEMAKESERLGFKYLGLSDHSQTAAYAGGLNNQEIIEQKQEIAEANKKLKKLKILHGTESDILADGALDFPNKILKELDFVIASVHSRFKMKKDEMTKRIVAAISNPYTKILGHLTGRLLLARAGYELNFDAIIEAAAKHRVAIEINSNPHRLDMDWRHLHRAKQAGVKFAINPDAHSPRGLSDTHYGIGIARKGWLTKDDILNTKSLEEITEYFYAGK